MFGKNSFRKKINFLNRRVVVIAGHDLFMAALSLELAIWIRYQTYGAPQNFFFLWHATVIFTVLCAIIFLRTGLYRGVWHYSSLSDLTKICKAVTISLLAFVLIMFSFDRLENFPRTAIFIEWPLLVIFLSAPRIIYRYLNDGNLLAILEIRKADRIPILLIGAGDEAETFIREVKRSSLSAYEPIGLIDMDGDLVGRDIRGVRVLGQVIELEPILDKLSQNPHPPQRLVITSIQIDGDTVRYLLELADRHGLILSRLPRITEFQQNEKNQINIKPIDVEDLLRRPQRNLNLRSMLSLIEGKGVLVTGAGGTIGSELIRQIATLKPARLILLDNNEHALYEIDGECAERWVNIERHSILCDVRNGAHLNALFSKWKPNLVFHAAAFKHVPMVEENPSEGVLTNSIGTARVAEAAITNKVNVMVLVSTDKSVNPTNVMGASKRVAEAICQSYGQKGSATRFLTVRFGNVLGSAGSVVPLFEKQLSKGGPLTVTHPEITRYFMTTREAVELMLQATATDPSSTEFGTIFVLDMGQPVLIQDLAKQMIRLAGLRPGVDINIEFTGLRKGEKLHEELFHDTEITRPTDVSGLLLAKPRPLNIENFNPLIQRLQEAAAEHNREGVLQTLKILLPESNLVDDNKS